MKPFSINYVWVALVGFLSGCGGISTSSESHNNRASGNTVANNTSAQQQAAVATQEESIDQGLPTAQQTTPVEGSNNLLADIDISSAAAVATAATNLAKQSLVSNEISATNTTASFKTETNINTQSRGQLSVSQLLVDFLPIANTIAESTEPSSLQGECGGVAVTESTQTYGNSEGFPYEVDASVIFDDFCTGLANVYSGLESEDIHASKITFSGAGEMSSVFPSDAEGHYEFTFNFLVNTNFEFMPPTVALNQTVGCSYHNGFENFDPNSDCNFSIAFESDGKTFSATDYIVTGDNTIGYDVEITVADQTNESYSASFSGLTVCDNGNFGNGQGTLIYQTKEFNISYTSCNEAVVSHQTLRHTLQL